MEHDLFHSLVPLYERALALPYPTSLITLQILRVQILLYAHHGPPTTATLGITPNEAVRCVFEDWLGDATEAERAFDDYVADGFA
jgi:hypothetical protein